MQAYQIARKPCGLYGTPIEGNEFCAACLDYFRGLSDLKVAFETVVRRVHRHCSGVSSE